MLTRLATQELVDGLSAVALGASVVTIARQGASAALRPRLAFAFGGLCLFFALRAASDAFEVHALDMLSSILVCALPLAALLLAEGVLRRHAPRPLKVLVTFGGLVVAIALVAADGRPPATSWGLGVYVLLSLCGVTGFMLLRDRASLSRQETASVEALIAAGVVLTLLSLTDFIPRIPAGLSGLGAAIVAGVVGANPSSARQAQRVLTDIFVMTLIAAAGAWALSGPLGSGPMDLEPMGMVGRLRMAAILLALLLAASAVLSVRRRGAERATQAFARALATADVSHLHTFLGGLSDQPLLAGLRLAQGAMLAEYDSPGLATAMAARAVWTRPALIDPQSALPRALEELGDLMARTEATHALKVSDAPLRIALLTLPGVGPNDEAETNLALFQKLAAIAAQDHGHRERA